MNEGGRRKAATPKGRQAVRVPNTLLGKQAARAVHEASRVSREQDAARRQMRMLRVNLLLEVGGIASGLLTLLATATFLPFIDFGFGAAPQLIRGAGYAIGGYCLLAGFGAGALIFLRHGIVWPPSVNQHIQRLERQVEGAPPAGDPPAVEVEEDEESYSAYDLIDRLEREIEDQGNRANLNLVLGGFAAILALGLLLWVTLDTSRQLQDAIERSVRHAATTPVGETLSAYLYWGPVMGKLLTSSTSAFIAFFFLSTYRRNLTEIRYFHNELTNIEARIAAIEFCDDTEGGDVTKLEILKGMGTIERNFVLRNGESTIDLIQKNLDREETASFVESILRAVGRADGARS